MQIALPLGRIDPARLLGYEFPPASEADAFVRTNEGQVWVAELEPYRRQLEAAVLYRGAGPGLGVLGRTGLGRAAPLTLRRPVAATLRYSSAGGGMVTAASDDPPSTWIEGRLRASDIVVSRELPKRGERFGGILAQVSAELVLEATDGEADELLDAYVWRDRPVRLRLGRTSRIAGREVPGPLAEFETVFEGLCVQAYSRGTADLTVTVQDGSKKLDALIQSKTYAGTGGRHGGIDLTGKRVPLTYGYCRSVEPVPVDRVRGIWQAHDGEYRGLLDVRDKGVSLQPTVDVPTYEALEALTVEGEDVVDPDIPLGAYATCRTEGFLRTGGATAELKIDIEGDGLYGGPRTFDGGRLFDTGIGFDAPGSQTHSRYAGGMLFRILTTRANIPVREFDLDRVVQFDRENPYRQGIHIGPDETPTCREVCARIVDSIGACLARNREGKLILRVLGGPASGVARPIPAGALAEGGLQRLQLPWEAPWHTVRVQYARRWAPSALGELSVELPLDAQAELAREFSYADQTDAELKALLPDRDPLIIDSLLVDAEAAHAVAARYLGFYARQLMLRATVRGIGFRADPLETVSLMHPRYGLAQGRSLLVVSSAVRAARNETDLILFG